MKDDEARLGWDGDVGIYFDRTKPIAGDDGQCPDRGQLYEECEPIDVCIKLQAEIEQLRADNERLEADMKCRNQLGAQIEQLRAEVDEYRALKAAPLGTWFVGKGDGQYCLVVSEDGGTARSVHKTVEDLGAALVKAR